MPAPLATIKRVQETQVTSWAFLSGDAVASGTKVRVVLVATMGGSNASHSSTSTGWTQAGSQFNRTTVNSCSVWICTDATNAQNFTISVGATARRITAIALDFDTVNNSATPGGLATNLSTNPNPSNNNTGAARDYTWLAVYAASATALASAAPTNFSGLDGIASISSAQGMALGFAYYDLAATAALDPSSFTRSSTNWLAFTVPLYDDGSGGGVSVTPANSAHINAASSPTLAAKSTVSPNNAASIHTATSPSLAAKSSVVPDSTAHAHTATSPAIATANSVIVDGAAHISTASHPSVAAASSVTPDDASHILASTAPTLSAASNVLPDGSAHAASSTSPSLAAVYPIAPDSATHLATSTQPTITLAGAVSPDSSAHDTAATSPTLAPRSLVSVDSAAHVSDASEPSLSGSVTIAPASAFHGQIAGSPSIAWAGSVAANDVAHSTSVSEPSLSARSTVAPEGSAHEQSATSPTISTTTSVMPASTAHIVVAGVPSIRITMPSSARRSSATDYVDRGATSDRPTRIASNAPAPRGQVTAVSNRTAVSVRSAR